MQVRLGVQGGGAREEVELVLRAFEHHGAHVDGWTLRGVSATGVMSEFDVSSPTRRELDRALEELRGARTLQVLWLVDLPQLAEA